MGMNWLITGGCGFIGTSLIRRIRGADAQAGVRILDNLSTGTREDLRRVTDFKEIPPGDAMEAPRGVELVVGDILDEQAALQVTNGVDVVVHLAANTGVGPSVENPRADCYANVIGTLNYLEACRTNGIPRFIFASSGAPAGEVEPPIHEELPAHPVSPYGASKLAGEGYCSAYKKSFGIDTIALRFGNVYGPGSIHKSSVVAKFIRQAVEGEALEIYGDGSQTRDFIYIDDLIDVILLAAAAPDVGGEIFQVASNRETTVAEMADRLLRILEEKGVERVRVINTEVRVGDVKRNYSDTSKARRMLGWRPRVDLEEGLARTIDYFLEEGR